MKTIRQIADEIGVSKQAVYKRFKGKLHTVCAPYAHTEQGVLYIEEQGETLIKQDFLQKECSVGAHTYAHTERSNGEVLEQSENVGVIAVLQTTIDTLQGQLAIKDKQIEDLNARLSESNAALVAAQQTAQAAQALHAGTIQQQALAVRGAEAEQTVKQQVNTIELQKAQITSLERQLRPSIQKRLKEAQELSDLKDENMALEYELNRQKDLMARLMQRVEAALTFLEEKLPEQFRPYVQRARAHIMPEPKQEHRHDRGMSMGGMSR